MGAVCSATEEVPECHRLNSARVVASPPDGLSFCKIFQLKADIDRVLATFKKNFARKLSILISIWASCPVFEGSLAAALRYIQERLRSVQNGFARQSKAAPALALSSRSHLPKQPAHP